MQVDLNGPAWLAALHKRQEEVKQQCFDFPPSDYAEFQRYLGQYQELSLVISHVKAALSNKEDEEDKP